MLSTASLLCSLNYNRSHAAPSGEHVLTTVGESHGKTTPGEQTASATMERCTLNSFVFLNFLPCPALLPRLLKLSLGGDCGHNEYIAMVDSRLPQSRRAIEAFPQYIVCEKDATMTFALSFRLNGGGIESTQKTKKRCSANYWEGGGHQCSIQPHFIYGSSSLRSKID